ncbi:zinc-dependent alcohol dehydrogenase [Halorubrum vacuolatum]|uniref:2-desacetyl-2-hydroxyethyl bacteriochlorophyllide A dehydrogenase n=1 Tax=Halorubrum vacuolatum TaxID=63740 RepID=A0A238WY06_HALVU|nr:zinc-binding alcohol dehydrogenase [Halorubrum vacuolatum]SNR51427.1 2-desacetyl-2-hydroxyethyl bacteriochlorophyllide A dehydrogenase [Halorubrum vacuolatum]
MAGSALYFTAPGSVETEPIDGGPPDRDEVAVETVASAISAGTELLVYRGQAPTEIPRDKTIEALSGEFSYPMRYGYAAVGEVQAVGEHVSNEWAGRTVFSFTPHQTRFTASPDVLVPVPPEMDAETATLIPSVETATTLALDLGARLGEEIVVFGAGVIGLCLVRLLAAFPLDRLVVVDPIERRRTVARELGADETIHPDDGAEGIDGFDAAVELSGRPAVLDDAVSAVGYGGRVIVGSWYGTKRAPIDLGGRFHRDRITIRSSQVSTIAPELRGRWDTERRISTVLDRLDGSLAETLISHRVPFERAEEAYELLDGRPEEALQVVLTY